MSGYFLTQEFLKYQNVYYHSLKHVYLTYWIVKQTFDKVTQDPIYISEEPLHVERQELSISNQRNQSNMD